MKYNSRPLQHSPHYFSPPMHVNTLTIAVMGRDEIIAWYFNLGYSYSLIVCFLYYVHGVSLSLRQFTDIHRCICAQTEHRVYKFTFK